MRIRIARKKKNIHTHIESKESKKYLYDMILILFVRYLYCMLLNIKSKCEHIFNKINENRNRNRNRNTNTNTNTNNSNNYSNTNNNNNCKVVKKN